MTDQTDSVPSRTLDRFKRWFWRRPRAHGDTIRDRRVSPLESLYDPVYAVVISQAAQPLEQSHRASLTDDMGNTQGQRSPQHSGRKSRRRTCVS